MSRSATRDNSNPIGLFPFLAVLMSTMGALLVVLAVVAQCAGERAAIVRLRGATAVPQVAGDAAELARELDKVRSYQRKLEDLRKEGEARVREEQARLSHGEEHARRLEHELAQLVLASQQLEATEKNQSVDQEQAAAELERLRQAIVDTEQQLDELRKSGGTRRSYAVVPYQGQNGTLRKPIYIECSAQGITIQPEGLQFERADFIDPTWPGNPLAAALRASREYLNQKAAEAGKPEPPDPYPLILVRPDGITAYVLARAAITSWDSDFGYEFIDGDWKIEYPDLPDPQLARVQHHAVMIARERLQHLVQAAPSQFRGVAIGPGRGGGRSGGGGSGWGTGNGSHEDGSLAGAYGGGSATGNGAAGGSNDVAQTGDDLRDGDQLSEHASSEGEFQYGGMAGGPASSGQSSAAGESAAAGDAGGDTYAGSPGGGSESASGSSDQSQGAGATGAIGGPATSGSATANASAGGSGASGATSTASASLGAGGPAGQSTASATGPSGGAPSLSVPIRPKMASIAESRGSDWAVEKAMHNAIPVRRPIQVVVRHNQMALLPSRHASDGVEATGTVISLDQPLEKISDDFITALKTRVGEWGLAGNGLYWRPVLELHVGPDAAETAHRLNHLLKDSGVEVRLPETAQAPNGGTSHAPR